MRKSTKLLSICCLCLFSFFLFAGCGTITYTYSTGLDGSIQENFTISLDSDALSNDGIDTLATMTKLDEIIDNWWTTTSSNLVEQDSVTFTNEPTNPTKRSITIKYASSEAYSQFYNIPPSNNNTSQNIIPSTFCDKLIMCNRPIQLNQFAPLDIYTQIVEYLANTYYNGDISTTLSKLDNITTNIIYVFPAKVMVHSNADYVERNGVYSAHMWSTDLSTLTTTNPDEQKNMYIYRNYYSSTNIANWYLLALGLTLVFGLIIFVVLATKHKKTTTPTDTTPQINNSINTANNTTTNTTTNTEQNNTTN